MSSGLAGAGGEDGAKRAGEQAEDDGLASREGGQHQDSGMS